MVIRMVRPAQQAQFTKKYIKAMGMASQTLVLQMRGFLNMDLNMHLLLGNKCFKNNSVTSSQTGPVIQQPRLILFHLERTCKVLYGCEGECEDDQGSRRYMCHCDLAPAMFCDGKAQTYFELSFISYLSY